MPPDRREVPETTALRFPRELMVAEDQKLLTGGYLTMAVISMKALLEAGVHFGHRTRRWNPKMKPYIFTERNGIHIIDLQQTLSQLEKPYAIVPDTASQGGNVLFAGSKEPAQESFSEGAARSS